MKKYSIFIIALILALQAYSQRVLEWSIGQVKVSCDDTVHVCYPLMVSINDDSNSPVLSTSTMRMFYNSNDLENFNILNIENGYSISGLMQSNPVFGEVFGFNNANGIFVQFNILDNAKVSPLELTTTPKHVLDFCFDISEDAKYPICLPIVFDNNHEGANQGIEKDAGYLISDAGVVGGYYLDNYYDEILQADDEVVNFAWQNSNTFKGKVKKGKRVGQLRKDLCIKRNICNGPDCDDDGTPDVLELDLNEDGIPDDCQNNNGGGNGNGNGNAFGNSKIGSRFESFPVPFDDEVFVKYQFHYDTEVLIEVFDTKGILVRSINNRDYKVGEFYQQRIDLSKTSNQLLFVKISTRNEVLTKQIVSSSLKIKE